VPPSRLHERGPKTLITQGIKGEDLPVQGQGQDQAEPFDDTPAGTVKRRREEREKKKYT
jgi:hypothetical protein